MALAAVSAGLSLAAVADAGPAGSTASAVEIGDGITLHYVAIGPSRTAGAMTHQTRTPRGQAIPR